MSIESVFEPIGDALGSIGGAIGNVGGIVNTIRGLTGGDSDQSSSYIRLAGQSAADQAGIAREQARLAREQWETYKNSFLPLEKQQAQEAARDMRLFRPLKEAVAAEGLSGLKRMAPLESKLMSQAISGIRPDVRGAAAGASAQVKQSFAKVRDQNSRGAGKSTPNHGGLAYLDRITDLSQAASEAAARTAAARDEKARAEELSWERLKQAMNLGRGLPSAPASSLAPAGSAGLGADTASRAAAMMSSAVGGLGQAASGYTRAGQQMAAIESSGFGTANSFAPTTDLADIWNSPGLYGLPGGTRYGDF